MQICITDKPRILQKLESDIWQIAFHINGAENYLDFLLLLEVVIKLLFT